MQHKLDEEGKRLRTYFQKKGFLDVAIRYTWKVRGRHVDVSLSVAPRSRYTVGRITWVGNKFADGEGAQSWLGDRSRKSLAMQ